MRSKKLALNKPATYDMFQNNLGITDDFSNRIFNNENNLNAFFVTLENKLQEYCLTMPIKSVFLL